MKKLILVCFLIIFNSLKAASICHTEQSNNTVYMKQAQDHVGFCGLFALRALYHQQNCRTLKGNCKLPSILEFMSMAINAKYYHKTDTEEYNIIAKERQDHFVDIINNINSANSLVSEKCLSLDSLFPKKKIEEVAGLNWQDNYRKYSNMLTSNYINSHYDHNTDCYDLSSLSLGLISKDSLINILISQKASDKILQSSIDVKKEEMACLKSKATRFRFVRSITPHSGKLANMRKSLQSVGSVLVGLSIKEGNAENIGPHAVVITNYKITCCHNVCVRQYHLLDSLSHYWATSAENGWVNEKDLLNSMKHPGDYSTLIQIKAE